MATSMARSAFINQIASQYADNDLYSDITLHFSSTTLHAHRIVLASQSTWFLRRLEGTHQLNDMPTSPQTLDLGDGDDPALLSALLKYLYTRAYPALIDETGPPEPKAHVCLRHLRLYELANKYGVACAQAAAADRVRQHMGELYAYSADLLTDFVPFLYGDALTPAPLSGDAHGLRAFVAETAARDRLERVESCEMERYIAEKRLKGVLCRACDYSMEITVNDVEQLGGRNSRLGMWRGSEDSSIKLEDLKDELYLKACPNCQGELEKQFLM
ncbi:putative btb poz-like protein [Neofusicoccum parvum UCRNP2]|uniref:Putative btb poz-like protein n=1 Tax=Botryosphaeria parva (strain UCR-NP2) TaxID=1287680 RepID=R1EP97_BOTPV|nr:putative btb poz-like protein [Neofusicoccum parvum UCRNP2]